MRPQNYRKWGQAAERMCSLSERVHLPPRITVNPPVHWADALISGLWKLLSLNLFGTAENTPSDSRQMRADNIKHLVSLGPPGESARLHLTPDPAVLWFLGWIQTRADSEGKHLLAEVTWETEQEGMEAPGQSSAPRVQKKQVFPPGEAGGARVVTTESGGALAIGSRGGWHAFYHFRETFHSRWLSPFVGASL